MSIDVEQADGTLRRQESVTSSGYLVFDASAMAVVGWWADQGGAIRQASTRDDWHVRPAHADAMRALVDEFSTKAQFAQVVLDTAPPDQNAKWQYSASPDNHRALIVDEDDGSTIFELRTPNVNAEAIARSLCETHNEHPYLTSLINAVDCEIDLAFENHSMPLMDKSLGRIRDLLKPLQRGDDVVRHEGQPTPTP